MELEKYFAVQCSFSKTSSARAPFLDLFFFSWMGNFLKKRERQRKKAQSASGTEKAVTLDSWSQVCKRALFLSLSFFFCKMGGERERREGSLFAKLL